MILSSPELGELFRTFTESAFRLETHQTYTMAGEQAGLNRFLAGEPKPVDHNSGWMRTVHDNVASGRTMQRVKLVRKPFTDYTRFLFAWAIPGNVDAGEDYRILDITDKLTGLPKQDFWLFDDTTVALLNFAEDGTLMDRELVESDIEQYRMWRDVAVLESVPFHDYQQ